MKHILYATTGIALALAFAGTAKPVMADVDVFASISKLKDIHVQEFVTITKNARINVQVIFDLDGGAEANAVMNVTNVGNTVDGQDIPNPTGEEPGPFPEYGIHLSAVLGGTEEGSVNGNRGVFGVNQDVGNMTNQGNVVSVAGVQDLPFESFAQSQAHADQLNEDNAVFESETLRDVEGAPIEITNDVDPTTFGRNKEAIIANSINDNVGVINVNQNSGNMNNQTNGLAAAIGIGAEFAMSEADLGQTNVGNHVDELETVKVGSITGSVNGNTGVVQVNQSTGNMNNQGNVVSVSAIISGAFIDTQNP